MGYEINPLPQDDKPKPPAPSGSGGQLQRPQIVLEFKQVLCTLHGQAFKPKWPSAYPTYSIEVFQAALALPEVLEQSHGLIEEAVKILDKKPACCLIGTEVWLKLIRQIHDRLQNNSPWKIARCTYCGSKKRLGCKMRFESTIKGIQVVNHLCFRCLCEQVRPDPARN